MPRWKVRDPEHGVDMDVDVESVGGGKVVIEAVQAVLSMEMCARGIWVIIPGLGEPEIARKMGWVWSNVSRIRATIPREWYLFIMIAQYSEAVSTHIDPLHRYPRLRRVIWCTRHHRPSYLGSFLREEMRPEWIHPRIMGVLVLLDDVEIEASFDLSRLMARMEMEDLHTISPCLSRASVSCHWFMHTQFPVPRKTFRRTNFVELFCQLFTVHGYTRWHRLLLPFTTYLWGVDMAMHHQGFRMGILETMRVIHHLSSQDTTRVSPVYRKMQEECARYTRVYKNHIAYKFKNLWIVQHPSRSPLPVLRIDESRINPRYGIRDPPPPDP